MTIYSIAERCQVSTATVSRALSRPELVRPELRERILVAAHEMGYRVNRNARRLATGRSGLVAVLVPDITNPYFPPLVRELGRALSTDDTSVLMVDTAEDPERELAAIRRLHDEIDGFVMVSPRSSLQELQNALKSSRAVLVNRPSRSLASVIADESLAFEELFNLLSTQGHHSAAYVGGPADSWVNGRRRSLATGAAASVGIELTVLGPFAASVESGPEAAAAVIDSGVTAAIAFDDMLALGIGSHLRQLGVRVPEDVSLIGCDDLSIGVLQQPALSSIGIDARIVAVEAVRLLAEATPGQLAGESVSVGGRLVQRGTIGPAPHASHTIDAS